MSCLHCGRTGTTVIRVPATRVAKRDNDMNPRGWYYFTLCDRCQTLPVYEYAPLWKVYSDRLVHSNERISTNSEAFEKLNLK